MPLSLSASLCEQFSERLSAKVGLYFPRDRWVDLERGLVSVSADLGIADLATCVRHLLATEWDRPHIEMLASHLTVGETYFFREPRSFEVLSHHVLPELIRTRRDAGRDIHIWSAACCSGEEAYSLAILLDTLIPDRADWTIRILATDINPSFLRRAAAGIYSEWSFRGVPETIKKAYFLPTPDGAYRIIPKIKRMVTFGYANLADENNKFFNINDNSIDVLFCRNALMYFREETIRGIVSRFKVVLNDGGWLFTSAVEGASTLFDPFIYSNLDGVTLYRKRGTALAPAAQIPPTTAAIQWIDPIPVASEDWPPPPPIAVSPSQADEPSTFPSALALYEKGSYGEAIALLRVHLAAMPADMASMLLLARSYANQGRLADGRQWCEQAIAHDRLSAPGHYLLSIIQQEQGELEEASASLQRTLFLDPHFALAHFALANLAYRQGRGADASKHYRNTAALLGSRDARDILPDSDGMTVGRLLELAHQGGGGGGVLGKARNV